MFRWGASWSEWLIEVGETAAVSASGLGASWRGSSEWLKAAWSTATSLATAGQINAESGWARVPGTRRSILRIRLMGVRLNGLILLVIPWGPLPISQIRRGSACDSGIVFLSRLPLHCPPIFSLLFRVKLIRDPCTSFAFTLRLFFWTNSSNRRLTFHVKKTISGYSRTKQKSYNRWRICMLKEHTRSDALQPIASQQFLLVQTFIFDSLPQVWQVIRCWAQPC